MPRLNSPFRSRRWTARAAIAMAACAALESAAQDWDPLPGGAGPGDGIVDGGPGAWDFSMACWTSDSGANNDYWLDGGSAIFGGLSGGTVTIFGELSAGAIQFDVTGDTSTYLLIGASSADMLTLLGPGITTHQDARIDAALAGTAAWSKLGAATLTLGGANTMSGPITVSEGTLALASDSAAGTGAILVNSGATLVNHAATISNPVTLAGGKLSIREGDATFTGPMDVAADSTVSVPAAGKTLNLAGTISGSSALSVDVGGGGMLSVTSSTNFNGVANTFTGNIAVSSSEGTAGSVVLGYRIDAPSGQIFSASAGTLTLGNSIPGAVVRIGDGASVQSTGGTIQLMGRAAGPGAGVIVQGDLAASGGGQIIVGDGLDDAAQIQFGNTTDFVINGGTITLRPRATALVLDGTNFGTISMRQGAVLALAGNADFTLNRDVGNPSGTWVLANQSSQLFRIVGGSQDSTAGMILRAEAGTIRYETNVATIGMAMADGTFDVELRGGVMDITATSASRFNYAPGYTLTGWGQVGTSVTNQVHGIAAGGNTFAASGPGNSTLSLVGGLDESAGKASFQIGDGDAISLSLPNNSVATAQRLNGITVDSQTGVGFARLILPTGFAAVSGTAITGAANKLRFEISGGTLVSDITSTGSILLSGGSFGASVPITVSNNGTFITSGGTFTLKSSESAGGTGTLFGAFSGTNTALTLNGLVELNGTIGGSIALASTGTLKLNAGSTLTLGAAADLSNMTLAYAGESGVAALQVHAPSATARIAVGTGVTAPYGPFNGTRQFIATAGTLQIDAADAKTVSITGTNTLVIDRTNDGTANPAALGTLTLNGGAFQVGSAASTNTVAVDALLSGRGSLGHAALNDLFINQGTVMASGGALTILAATNAASGGIRGSGTYNPAAASIVLSGDVSDTPGTPTQLRVVGASGFVELNRANSFTGGTHVDGSSGNSSLAVRITANQAMGTGAMTINDATLAFATDVNLSNSGRTPPMTFSGSTGAYLNFTKLATGSSRTITVGAITVTAPAFVINGADSHTLSAGGITFAPTNTYAAMWGSVGGATVTSTGLALNGAALLDIGGITFNTGRISGSGSLTRTWDSGRLNFTGAANGFTGSVNLWAGESNFNASNTLSGGTYRLSGKNVFINSAFALNGASGIVQNGTVSVFVNLQAANALSGTTMTVNSGSLYANVANALGTADLTLAGGVLNLWNDAATNFGGGTIRVGGSVASQIILDRSKSGAGSNQTHTISNLTLQNQSVTVIGYNGYALSIPGGITVAGGGTSALSNYTANLAAPTITLNGGLTILGTGPASIGNLGGTGSFVWNSTGVLTLAGAAQPGYAGLFQLPNGQVSLSTANVLRGGTAVVSGGVMNLNTADALATVPVTLTSGFIKANVPQALNSTTVAVANGTLMAAANNAMGNSSVQMTGGNLTATAPNALGSSTISIDGAILALRGDSSASFGGSVTITGTSAATLSAAPITTEFGPTGNTLTLQQLSLGGQTINITGGNDYIFAVASPVAMAGSNTTTFNATAADALFQGALTGAGPVVKTGWRKVTLDGGGTFGVTTVSEGTLVVNGAWTTSGVTVGSSNGAAVLQMGGAGVNAPGNLTIANGTLRIAKSLVSDAIPTTSQINTASAGDVTVEYAGLAGGTSQGVLTNPINVNLGSGSRTLTISSASGSVPGQSSAFVVSGLITPGGGGTLTVVARADAPRDDGLGNLVRSPSRMIMAGNQTFSTALVHGGGIVIAKGASISNGGSANPLGVNTSSLNLTQPDSAIGGMVADGGTASTFTRNVVTSAGASRARLGAFYNPLGGAGTQTVTANGWFAWNEAAAPLFGVMPAGNPAGAMSNSTWNGLVADPGTVLQINSGAVLDNVLTVSGGTTITGTAPMYAGGGGTIRFNSGFDEASYRNLSSARGLSGTVTVLDGTTLESLTAGRHFEGVELAGGIYRAAGSAQAMSGGLVVTPSPLDPARLAGQLITDASFTLNGTGIARALRIGTNQKLVKSGAGVFTVNADQAHGAGAALQADSGTVHLNTDAGMNGGGGTIKSLSLSASNSATVNLNVTQHLVQVAIGGNAVVKLASSATPGGKVLNVNSLSIAGGKLDLTNNALVVDYTGESALPGVRAAIVSGLNAGGSRWGGNGIVSTTAGLDMTLTVGYAEATDIVGASGGAFLGEGVDNSAVLVRYTRMGDANLDGNVNFADLVKVAQNYNLMGAAVWAQGDFNYDGNVNFVDLVAVAQNYNQSAAGSIPAGAALLGGVGFAADYELAFTGVPEPGIALLAATALMMLARRRRTGRPPP